jgi:antitoxin (DNA-binding transcriptional repressor) of toxin-antitoxin stability system
MINVSSHEMAPLLPRLLALVRGGEEIYITEEGQLVARMVPAAAPAVSTEGQSEDDDERPWRGVLAVPRGHRQAQSVSTSLPMNALPKRSGGVGMAWHRTDGINE